MGTQTPFRKQMNLNRLFNLDLNFLTDKDRSIFYAMAKKEIQSNSLSTARYPKKPMSEKQETQYYRVLNRVIAHFSEKKAQA